LKSFKGNHHFKILSRKTVFRGYVTELEVLKIQTASGRQVERELIHHPGAVVIIPRLPDGRLVFIRQLRVSTRKRIWEFPAGTVEKGEALRACADRELQEETGWKAGKLRLILEYFPTPGISTEKMYLFVAENLRPVTGVEPDPDEELDSKIFSPKQIESMIRKREIIDGKTILGFLFFRHFLDRR